MSIELPKDAEGREIPFDTVVLFSRSGEARNIVRWIYTTDFDLGNSLAGQWRALTDKFAKIDPKSFYLIQPDSWEKLLEDLKAVEDYGNSSHLDSPTCHYANMVGKPCDKCKFYGSGNCVGKMCADIAYRIRELRGED